MQVLLLVLHKVKAIRAESIVRRWSRLYLIAEVKFTLDAEGKTLVYVPCNHRSFLPAICTRADLSVIVNHCSNLTVQSHKFEFANSLSHQELLDQRPPVFPELFFLILASRAHREGYTKAFRLDYIHQCDGYQKIICYTPLVSILLGPCGGSVCGSLLQCRGSCRPICSARTEIAHTSLCAPWGSKVVSSVALVDNVTSCFARLTSLICGLLLILISHTFIATHYSFHSLLFSCV